MIALKSFFLLLIGTFCGFFSSSPPGPINLLLADSVLGERQLHRSSFIIGVIMAELLLAAIAFWGFQNLLMGSIFDRWIPIVGGVFVMGLGIIGLLARSGKRDPKREPGRSLGRKRSGAFFQGLFLCGSNPAFLIFWIYVMSALSYSGIAEGTSFKNVLLLGGIAIGNGLWFHFFLRILQRGADRLQGNPIPWLRKGISVLLILLGISGIWMYF